MQLTPWLSIQDPLCASKDIYNGHRYENVYILWFSLRCSINGNSRFIGNHKGSIVYSYGRLYDVCGLAWAIFTLMLSAHQEECTLVRAYPVLTVIIQYSN